MTGPKVEKGRVPGRVEVRSGVEEVRSRAGIEPFVPTPDKSLSELRPPSLKEPHKQSPEVKPTEQQPDEAGVQSSYLHILNGRPVPGNPAQQTFTIKAIQGVSDRGVLMKVFPFNRVPVQLAVLERLGELGAASDPKARALLVEQAANGDFRVIRLAARSALARAA